MQLETVFDTHLQNPILMPPPDVALHTRPPHSAHKHDIACCNLAWAPTPVSPNHPPLLMSWPSMLNSCRCWDAALQLNRPSPGWTQRTRSTSQQPCWAPSSCWGPCPRPPGTRNGPTPQPCSRPGSCPSRPRPCATSRGTAPAPAQGQQAVVRRWQRGLPVTNRCMSWHRNMGAAGTAGGVLLL
jgi:hypothetical protein